MALSSLSRGCARVIAPDKSGGPYSGRLDVCFTPHDYFIWKTHDSLLRVSKSGHLIGEDETAIPKTFSSRRGPLLLYAQDLVTIESQHDSAAVARGTISDGKVGLAPTIGNSAAAILTCENKQTGVPLLPPVLSSLHLHQTLHLQWNNGKEQLQNPGRHEQVASQGNCQKRHTTDEDENPIFPRLRQNSAVGSKHHVSCVGSKVQRMPPIEERKSPLTVHGNQTQDPRFKAERSESQVPKHCSHFCLPLLASLEKDEQPHQLMDKGGHRPQIVLQRVQDLNKSPGGAVRGLLPLQLRGLQGSRAMGCFILGPGGELIPLSLYGEHRSASLEDEGLVQNSRRVQSDEEEAFPWMLVLQSDETLSEMKATLSEAAMVSPEEQMTKESVQISTLLEVVELRTSAADVHEEEGKRIPKSQHHLQDVESRFQQTGLVLQQISMETPYSMPRPQSSEEASVKGNMEKPGKRESQAGAAEEEESADPDEGWKKWSRDKEPRRSSSEEGSGATRKESEAGDKPWERFDERRQQTESEAQPLRNQKTGRQPEKEAFVLPAPTVSRSQSSTELQGSVFKQEKTVSKEDLTPGDTGPETEKPRGRRLERKPTGEIEGKTQEEESEVETEEGVEQKKPQKRTSTQRQAHDSNTSASTGSSAGVELVQSGPVKPVAKVSSNKSPDKALTPIDSMQLSSSRGRLSSSCSTVMMKEEQLMLDPTSRNSLHEELTGTETLNLADETVRAKQEENENEAQVEEEQKRKREEGLRKMLEDGRRKRLEEKRLKKQAEEEEVRRREEMDQQQTRLKRAEREREKRRREDKKLQMERILRRREEEEQRRRAELERILLEEERQQEEERTGAMDERKRSAERRSEEEVDLWSVEKNGTQAELLTSQEVERLQHLCFKHGLLLEAEGLDRTQGISRPWVYSYFNVPQMLGQGPDHDP